MEAFHRLCTCGHRESQHKIVNKGIFYERTDCHVCDCKRFFPQGEIQHEGYTVGDKVRIVRLRKESIEHTSEPFLSRLRAKMKIKAIGVIEWFYFPDGTRPNVDFGDLKATLWEDEIEKGEN